MAEQLAFNFDAPDPLGLSFDDPDLTVTFDLPPKWDGQVVAWDEVWVEQVIPFICPPPKDKSLCECGSTWPRLLKTGRATGLVLRAHRCVDCHQDVIIDPEGKWWDLDPEDYGPQGSYLITEQASPNTGGASII